MSDDIVTRLRNTARMCDHDWNLGNDWYPAPTECISCVRQREAADEIERLRTMGDDLAKAYRYLGGLEVAYDLPLRAWEDTSRG